MTDKIAAFRALHQTTTPLLLGNVWDAPSASILEKLGFKALGTSSAAVANMLGHQDGEQMPYTEYRAIIRRITAVTDLPVSVDMEAGYTRDPLQVAKHIQELAALGIVGINLEDSLVVENSRQLVDPDDFSRKLAIIRKKLQQYSVDVFINLRMDTFLLNHPQALAESKRRVDLYSDFIDGVFLPCIAKEKDIEAIVSHTRLPLNVMKVSGLPSLKALEGLGVKRISTGNYFHDFMQQALAEEVRSWLDQGE